MKVLVTAGLRNGKLATKLAGFLDNPRVAEVILVRRTPLAGPPKLRNVIPSGPFRRLTLLYEIWRFFTLLRLCRQERPTAIVGIYLIAHGVQAALAARLTGCPCILSLIGDDVQKYLVHHWSRSALAWAVRGATMVTVMGPRSRDIALARGCRPQRIRELQNSHDHTRFCPDDNAREKLYDVIFVGDLIVRKRVGDLLTALAALKERLPITAAIVGDGPLASALSAKAESLGLAKAVDFLGRRGDVEALLRMSRVLVLPTAMEGLPAAAVEAMLCGLPVILADVGDIPAMFVHGDNALLVPSGDRVALASAMASLLTDSGLYEQLKQGALASRDQFIATWGSKGQIDAWDAILERAAQSLNPQSS